MKKITLVIAILTFGAQAQTFPSPYCEITDGNDVSVEEISAVDFADASILNTDAASVLIDETSTIATIAQDETYTIEVRGNTYGDFDTDIVAFIDWNQNTILDDAGEIYTIGTLSNSTGSDAVSVMLAITVPSDALLGTTRIRLTKTYQDADSPAEIDPCGILFNPFGVGVFAGFGQALDFSLEVEAPLHLDTFDLSTLSVFPNPTKNVLNINYTNEIHAVQIYNLLGQEVFTKTVATSDLKLDVSSLSAGTYVVQLIAADQQHRFKLLKQ